MKQSKRLKKTGLKKSKIVFWAVGITAAPKIAFALSIQECRHDSQGEELAHRYVAFTSDCPSPFAGCFDQNQGGKRIGCIYEGSEISAPTRSPASLGEVRHLKKVRLIE